MSSATASVVVYLLPIWKYNLIICKFRSSPFNWEKRMFVESKGSLKRKADGCDSKSAKNDKNWVMVSSRLGIRLISGYAITFISFSSTLECL